jgi:hypothetical protein
MRRWPTRPGHPNFSSRPLAHPAVHAQLHTNVPVPCLKTRKKGRCSCDPRGSSEQKPPNASGTTSNGQASGGRSANRWSMSRRCTGRRATAAPESAVYCMPLVRLLAGEEGSDTDARGSVREPDNPFRHTVAHGTSAHHHVRRTCAR